MRPAPPWTARRLLGLLAPPDIRPALDGDLLEDFHHDVRTIGLTRARRIYRRNVWRSAMPLLTIDTRWSDAPRILATAFACVIVIGAFSHLVGVLIQAAGVGTADSASALTAHVAIVVMCAPFAGYGAAWLAVRGGALTCAVAGAVVVAPAVAAFQNPGAPRLVVLAWIVMLPVALTAGGLWRMRHGRLNG